MLDQSLQSFLTATAAKTPTPGGGAVSGVAGALAASLAQMVLAYTLGKKKFEAFAPELQEAHQAFGQEAQRLAELITEDIQAYGKLSEWLKLKADARPPAFAAAVEEAIGVPMAMGSLALKALGRMEALLEKVNPLLLSDLGIAAELARATVATSELNILINLSLLSDRQEAQLRREKVALLTAHADQILQRVRQVMRQRLV